MQTQKNTVDEQTIVDFGKQWSRYTESPGWYGSIECLQDILGPLMAVDELKGRKVADVGSGAGRIVQMLLAAGASQVFGIEPSDGYFVLKRNVQSHVDRVVLLHADGEAVGTLRDLDLVTSFGVLDHIVEPGHVMNAAYRALRPGGKVVISLYGHEGNELYLLIFGSLRNLTRRLPDPVLSFVCSILNIGLSMYLALCRVLPLPMRSYMLNHVARLDRGVRKLTIFDQLNPAYARYFREAEARALVSDAGFENVQLYHRHGYSWTVRGTKPA